MFPTNSSPYLLPIYGPGILSYLNNLDDAYLHQANNRQWKNQQDTKIRMIQVHLIKIRKKAVFVSTIPIPKRQFLFLQYLYQKQHKSHFPH